MTDEPEAYKLGWVPFLGLKIWLDSKPLIPRPEAEWWTEQLLHDTNTPIYRYAAESQKCNVLDVCAGSGAIGCAILKYVSNVKVYFGEIDQRHEATIRKNIRENGLDGSRAEIRIGNLFEPFGDMQFDVIAANPPYVPEGRELPKSVADYEPALALRAGEDGLAVIRHIAAKLPQYLKPGGQAWIECDIENIDEAQRLFKAHGYHVKILYDQYERPRVIVLSS